MEKTVNIKDNPNLNNAIVGIRNARIGEPSENFESVLNRNLGTQPLALQGFVTGLRTETVAGIVKPEQAINLAQLGRTDDSAQVTSGFMEAALLRQLVLATGSELSELCKRLKDLGATEQTITHALEYAQELTQIKNGSDTQHNIANALRQVLNGPVNQP